MFPTFLIWVYFFQRVDPELPASKSPGLPVKNTKSWLYPIYIELGEGGQKKSWNLHFKQALQRTSIHFWVWKPLLWVLKCRCLLIVTQSWILFLLYGAALAGSNSNSALGKHTGEYVRLRVLPVLDLPKPFLFYHSNLTQFWDYGEMNFLTSYSSFPQSIFLWILTDVKSMQTSC